MDGGGVLVLRTVGASNNIEMEEAALDGITGGGVLDTGGPLRILNRSLALLPEEVVEDPNPKVVPLLVSKRSLGATGEALAPDPVEAGFEIVANGSTGCDD